MRGCVASRGCVFTGNNDDDDGNNDDEVGDDGEDDEERRAWREWGGGGVQSLSPPVPGTKIHLIIRVNHGEGEMMVRGR